MTEAGRAKAIEGCILGGAVGDALGLPREGLSPRRAERMFGGAPYRHRFLLGRGMMSDDTEHACITVQALIRSGGQPDQFARALAWGLRGWILCVPAGAGMATARACVKLLLGASPERSGVWSAGNGPAMRAAVIGAAYTDDLDRALDLTDVSSRMTHRDPRAIEGARLVALAAAHAATGQNGFFDRAATVVATEEWRAALHGLREALNARASAEEFGANFGQKGVSGFVMHTVPAALYCWLSHPDEFRRAVESAISLGGDTDTVAAIVGGIVGAGLGPQGIPREWIDGLAEWPRSTAWMRELSKRLAAGDRRPVRLFWPGLLPRNALFLAVVLGHGLWRLIDPRR